MEETFTFTARSAVDPSRVVTLTLHDHQLSVGTAPPLEQIQRTAAEGDTEMELENEVQTRPWLRPLAIALVEQATRPFPVHDVSADVREDRLVVRAWYRARGLRLLPITLISGRVDNPKGALEFVEELNLRRGEVTPRFGFLELFDYWATWAVALFSLGAVFVLWRRRMNHA